MPILGTLLRSSFACFRAVGRQTNQSTSWTSTVSNFGGQDWNCMRSQRAFPTLCRAWTSKWNLFQLLSCLIPLAQALLKWHWQWVLPPTSGTIKHCNWNSWGSQDLWILACAMDFLSLCILMLAFLQLQDLTVFSPEEGQGFCSEENPFPAPERLRQSRFWKESCLFLYLYLPPTPKKKSIHFTDMPSK